MEPLAWLASTEPSFFTTDKHSTPFPARVSAASLQRSRRSSRRTSGADPDALWKEVVLQRSRRSSRRTSCDTRTRGDARQPRASTEPSFFTTDKSLMCQARVLRGFASTEPSFFTTDKGVGLHSVVSRGFASTEPSFFTTDKLLCYHVRWKDEPLASTEPSFFTTDKRVPLTPAWPASSRFNGAVVLHDGQGDLCFVAPSKTPASTEPSFFTTDKYFLNPEINLAVQ